jgi:hypothetical protein
VRMQALLERSRDLEVRGLAAQLAAAQLESVAPRVAAPAAHRPVEQQGPRGALAARRTVVPRERLESVEQGAVEQGAPRTQGARTGPREQRGRAAPRAPGA